MRRLIYTIFLMIGIVSQTFSQNQNIIYSMDSLRVINNACAIRVYGGQVQYVMMPTLYNTTVTNGTVNFVTINAANLQMTQRYTYTPFLKGAIINDIRIASNGRIFFAGTQNGQGIQGELLSSGHLKKVRYDTAFREITAMAYLPFANSESILYCGHNNANKAVHGLQPTAGGARKMKITDNINTNKKVKDIASYVGGTQLLKCGGIILRYNSSSQVDLISFNASGMGTSSLSKTVNIPSGWQWHEGGGAITQVEGSNYVAVVDVRNTMLNVDGVFFIKFSVSSIGKISVYDTRVISMPEPKVVVKDVLYINVLDNDDPLLDDVSYNVIGQYITNSSGWPFLLKTDTTFTNYYALEYMTFQPNAEKCNFQLNKAVFFNDDNYPLSAVGSFDAFPGVFNTGGIYLTQNNYGQIWYYFNECESDIPLSSPVTSSSNSSLTLSGSVTSTTLLSADSAYFVNQFTPPAQNIICNKGDWPEEEKSLGKAVSNELFFSVQDNKIIMDDIDGGCFFDIYNSIGERVIHGHATNEIDISFLRKGLYIMRLSHNNEIISTYKFVR